MVTSAPQADLLLGWMDALADVTRLRILRLLERHELAVAELCAVVQLPQSTVSRHLRVLAEGGWVRSRREATAHLYRMSLDELEAGARKLWGVAREQTDDSATSRQDQLRLSRMLQDRHWQSQKFFAGAAGQWDKMRAELYGDAFSSAALLSLLPPEHVVADLGCGTAPLSAAVAPYVKRVIAVDSSPAMLRAARKRLADVKSVELRQGDLTALPIEDASCDAAMLVLVLTYLADPSAAIREAARILKPGGRVVVVDLLPHDREDFRRRMGQASMGFAPEPLARMLAEAGLAEPVVRELPPQPQAKGPALMLAVAVKR